MSYDDDAYHAAKCYFNKFLTASSAAFAFANRSLPSVVVVVLGVEGTVSGADAVLENDGDTLELGVELEIRDRGPLASGDAKAERVDALSGLATLLVVEEARFSNRTRKS
eukprot:m.129412 g.129412  ORF g.129412 m.129412 type:complete len:110 (+) comp15696_c0_seq5:219-548(+)